MAHSLFGLLFNSVLIVVIFPLLSPNLEPSLYFEQFYNLKAFLYQFGELSHSPEARGQFVVKRLRKRGLWLCELVSNSLPELERAL
ncbi:hypothetical protein ABT56_05585 [Photobacterium aquae]|uniref:Uncharacterized protein n=1 Tax=Photobacterium aquae TaxID=1195763 RepID=A0A0J1H5S9_9GAMM|nr:hypothetical protein ABT56_05585 [Photobacterium aquae]